MIIQHNIAAINSYRNLGINQSGLNKNLEKLSSGYRINRAGDDAAGLAISESMRSQINGLNQATKNAQDAVGLIQTVEGALTETHSMLQRLTTLASQSANGTYNTVARGNLQLEVDQLLQEIDRIANYTDFNGIKPIQADVAGTKMTFQIGPSAKETIVVNKQAMTASALGLRAGNLTSNAISTKYEYDKTGADDQKVNIKWAVSTSGNTAKVNVSTQTGGNKAIDRINDAINLVSQYRAGLGAAQNRLEHTINNLKVTSENITAAESRIRDTDMADEITAFTKNNILLQASQSMLAQSNSVPQSILSLIG
ncbi:MAG: flagellin [Lachnospiraceae bacterium]|nr:flagellin [Lachnospiraceae bacterium]